MLSSQQNQARVLPRPRAGSPEKENRRIQRIALPLPVRIDVRVDKQVTWYQITRLSDVSAFGAGFMLKKPIKRGRIVLMTLPMPRQLRSFDYSEPQYKIWGLVRRCLQSVGGTNPEYAIGIAFIGKNPPVDYIEHPARLYDVINRDDSHGFYHIEPANLQADENHLPKEDRKQTRYSIPEQLVIEQIDENGKAIFSEITVTENISLGGASVLTTINAATGSFVRVKSPINNVDILSVVRGSRLGTDGMMRLHIEFIDRFYPLGLE
jgi:hypothetical protein